MDEGQLAAPRRESTASHRTTVSDSATRKAASIYEINDLYSALQELVSSSPGPEPRRRRGTGLNFDSSDSWTSGADSPDVRSRPLSARRNTRVVRSTSSITPRFSGAESPVDLPTERRMMKSPEMRVKKLSNQRPPIGRNNATSSPKLALKKSKSDVSRIRSRSSVEGVKTMAEKIRDQRLKFTQGLRRREMEEEGCIIEGKRIKNIDDLVEWAKLDTGLSERGKKKRKKTGLKGKFSIEGALSKLKPNCSDSNLKSLEVTSRLDRWYEKASAYALCDIEDDQESFESYSGSESDEIAKGATLKKGKSLDDIDFELGAFTPEDLLDKWMKQKKNSLMIEERGRSGSETSVEPVTPEESDSSLLSIAKDDLQLERSPAAAAAVQTSTPLVIDRIIVSQPSMDESKGNNDMDDVLGTNLPNQPIFYIPNLPGNERSKTTVIYEEEQEADTLLLPSRPRSRSEISMGTTFDKRDEAAWKEIQKIADKRSKSFGSVHRRPSLEAAVKEERQEKLSRTRSDFTGPRPRSLILNSGLQEKSSKYDEDGFSFQQKNSKDKDANANIYQREKKADKGKKFSKLPGKLKTLLSGKKV